MGAAYSYPFMPFSGLLTLLPDHRDRRQSYHGLGEVVFVQYAPLGLSFLLGQSFALSQTLSILGHKRISGSWKLSTQHVVYPGHLGLVVDCAFIMFCVTYRPGL